MDLNLNNMLTDSLSLLRQGKTGRVAAYKGANTLPDTLTPATQSQPVGSQAMFAGGTRLIEEQQQPIDNGYRFTRIFEKEDGRTFSKIEEITLTERGSRRTVLQQNPSGSITRYEEVLDREQSGDFRRTQRFQENNGDVITQITPGYRVTDSFTLTGRMADFAPSTPAFAPSRGTQLDLQA